MTKCCNKELKKSAPIDVPNCYELVEQQKNGMPNKHCCGGLEKANDKPPIIAMQFCGGLIKHKDKQFCGELVKHKDKEVLNVSCCKEPEKKSSLSDVPTCYKLAGHMVHLDKKEVLKMVNCSNKEADATCLHQQLQINQKNFCCESAKNKEEAVLKSIKCCTKEQEPNFFELVKQQLQLDQGAPTNLKLCGESAKTQEKDGSKAKECINEKADPTFFELIEQKLQRDKLEAPTKQPIIPMQFCCELARKKEKEVFAVISKALQLYKPNEIFLSFNGGKDCTVLLHMLVKYFNSAALKDIRLPVLYIKGENRFPELDEFVRSCCKRYPNIDIIECSGDIKKALTEFCAQNPHLKAVFMGSRRTDPYCSNLKEMHISDPGWPALMRINPILDWTCHHVWNYMLANAVSYCRLYDLGYTSLGDTTNTKRNPHLKYVDPDTCEVTYMPAYAMPDDDTLERAGRNCGCYC